MISAPRESVRLYLQDPRNLTQYESKISSLQVSGGEAGRFQAQGSGTFLGLPWTGAIDIELTADGGYRAEMAGGTTRMTTVYQLRSVTGGTILRHEEHYHFGMLLRPVAALFRGAIGHSMELELRVIKEEAERVNRRIQLAKIEQAA